MWGFIVTIPCIHKTFSSSSHVLPSLTHPYHTPPCLRTCRCVPVFPCWLQKRASSVPNSVPSAFLSPFLFVLWTLQMREHVMITIFLVRLASLHKIALVPSIFLKVAWLCSFFPPLKTTEECCEHSYTFPFVDTSVHEIFMKEILCNIFKVALS